MAEPNLQTNAEAHQVEMLPGVMRRTLNHGERTSVHELHLEAGSTVPTHTHPHEQTGYLVSGRMRFEMPGLSKDLGPGDSWLVPGNVEHGVTALEDCVAIEIFSPVREEFLD